MKVIKVICENNARPCVKKTYEFLRMREITWSVKGTLNILLQSFSPTSIPYWTLKVEHIAAFTAIFSNICTALAQKRLFMHFRCKFSHRCSIHRPRFFFITVQNFGDLATFSVKFSILYVERPPYFYFRFVWPTDLESILHASTPTSIIPKKFEAPTPTPIRSWVMSDNVSHWLPLKMRTRPLRMRWITWPVSRGQKQSHARTVVRECCKGDDESQWEWGKFDPTPPKNPLTDGHQNLRR